MIMVEPVLVMILMLGAVKTGSLELDDGAVSARRRGLRSGPASS